VYHYKERSWERYEGTDECEQLESEVLHCEGKGTGETQDINQPVQSSAKVDRNCAKTQDIWGHWENDSEQGGAQLQSERCKDEWQFEEVSQVEAKVYLIGKDDNVNFFTIAMFKDELTYLI
jgi:hypothetical protein